MYQLPSLTRAQARAVDRIAMDDYGLTGLQLMENAGLNAALWLLKEVEPGGEVCVLCGGGNNGGDGYVLARQLASRGVSVSCFTYSPVESMAVDAAVNRAAAELMGLEVVDLGGGLPLARLQSAALCVDALVGTGFHGELRNPLGEFIGALNRTGAAIASLDVPSGFDADTGQATGVAVRASHTLTFVAPKVGFEAPGAHLYTGRVTVLPIGLPQEAFRRGLDLHPG